MLQGVLRGLQPDLKENPRTRRLVLVLVCVLVGVVGGVLTAAVSPFAGFVVVAALGVVLAVLINPLAGVLSFLTIAYVLPFAVIPVPIGGVRLTFVDAILTLCLAIWVVRLLVNPEIKLVTTRLDPFIVLFLGLAITSFFLGVESTQAEAFRFFLKAINSILFFFTVANCVRSRRQLETVIRVLFLATAAAAVLGVFFYFVNPALSTQLLGRLSVLGYPSGSDVLRYIADTNTLRAIGTSIDPNVFGGMFALAIPPLAAQLFTRAPLLPRRYLAVAFAISVICLGLTMSRGSWLGAVAGILFIGTLRYRKLWIAFVLLLVIFYFTPQGEFAAERLQSGIMIEDRATAMRMGEYKDALRLITAYPWFGVGFGSAPSIEYYVGASSTYLLMAEEMGLIGLFVFLVIIGITLMYALRNTGKIVNPCLQAIQVGLMGGLVGALVAGLFDHHFFNLKFQHVMSLFWFFVALVIVATRIGVEDAEPMPLEEMEKSA